MSESLAPLVDFIKVRTPQAWIEAAVSNIPTLLVDHAHCERKAAFGAIGLLARFPHVPEIVAVMSPLAREELLHFEKVTDLLRARNIPFTTLAPSSYATSLHRHVPRGQSQERLRDELIIGAIIEARSCERFDALVPALEDTELARFYRHLVRAEARHFEQYLELAHTLGGATRERLDFFLDVENALILSEDTVFRFHGGIPCVA